MHVHMQLCIKYYCQFNTLEYVMTTSVAVQIILPEFTCAFSECKNITFYCITGDIEWLNPANVLINATITNRIHSKKLLLYAHIYACLHAKYVYHFSFCLHRLRKRGDQGGHGPSKNLMLSIGIQFLQ